MLFQIACNQFPVIKKTWPNMLILSVSAGFNVLLNFKLIPIMGIEGAAIATLMGYLISVAICVIVLCRMKLMVIDETAVKNMQTDFFVKTIEGCKAFITASHEAGAVLAQIVGTDCEGRIPCGLTGDKINDLHLAIAEDNDEYMGDHFSQTHYEWNGRVCDYCPQMCHGKRLFKNRYG